VATRITAFGINPSDLTDREKEILAQHVHDYIHEEFDQPLETVDIEGYMEDR
jgi:hypothetical protein